MKKEKKIVQKNVPNILKKDGILFSNFRNENKMKTNIDKIIIYNDKKRSWSHCLVNSKSNSATLICQSPGEGNRKHYHPNWDEWWFILKGKWKFEIGRKKMIIKKGDFIFIKRKTKHKITATGKTKAIRLAVSRYDVAHIYK